MIQLAWPLVLLLAIGMFVYLIVYWIRSLPLPVDWFFSLRVNGLEYMTAPVSALSCEEKFSSMHETFLYRGDQCEILWGGIHRASGDVERREREIQIVPVSMVWKGTRSGDEGVVLYGPEWRGSRPIPTVWRSPHRVHVAFKVPT